MAAGSKARRAFRANARAPDTASPIHPPNPKKTHDMKTTSTRSWASKLVESFQNDGCKSAGDGVFHLTAEEADLLAPPALKAYEPWVLPLTVLPNDAAEEMADD